MLIEYTEWAKSFSLSDSDFTNIVETFAERFKKSHEAQFSKLMQTNHQILH